MGIRGTFKSDINGANIVFPKHSNKREEKYEKEKWRNGKGEMAVMPFRTM